MPKLRQELDADRLETIGPTEYKTDINKYPLPCGVCGRTLYVDSATADRYERAIKFDPDNHYICPDCEEEYADLAYE